MRKQIPEVLLNFAIIAVELLCGQMFLENFQRYISNLLKFLFNSLLAGHAPVHVFRHCTCLRASIFHGRIYRIFLKFFFFVAFSKAL